MNTQKLKRNEFLKDLGFKGAALFALYCTGTSCLPADVNPSATSNLGNSLTIDLSDSANSSLLSDGGYIIKEGVVIANNGGSYVAGSQICSHENKRKVIFRNGEFYCTDHGARFSTTGQGLNKDAAKGLEIYTVSQNENVLTIS
ncbi:ubiquinol-cytochrome c reductase iron-sulfur subunit [Jiulongibacter sediminis]|uniref:QcrA and Rieske domain-containing protein n=1 Tax=Jiulongibacter sediminis TaxID=1605367 RepID=UPI0026F1F1F9|nr:Rieske 2Fe-2S domain-containing protein [Jiulongibacter sediminis]